MKISSNQLILERKLLKNIYRNSLRKPRKNKKSNKICYQDQHLFAQISKVKKLKKSLIKKRIIKIFKTQSFQTKLTSVKFCNLLTNSRHLTESLPSWILTKTNILRNRSRISSPTELFLINKTKFKNWIWCKMKMSQFKMFVD